MRQMRIVGSILSVMLLLSACANAPDEEMAVPSLDASVEMLPEIMKVSGDFCTVIFLRED